MPQKLDIIKTGDHKNLQQELSQKLTAGIITGELSQENYHRGIVTCWKNWAHKLLIRKRRDDGFERKG